MRGVIIALLTATASAQAPGFGIAPTNDGRTAAVTGLFNWIHSSSDVDRGRFQDPGAPQFQFRVRDLDTLITASRRAGVPFVSTGQQPIQRPFGRFVFVTDPDGVFVEYVHPKP